MRVRTSLLLCAVLGGTIAGAGCRAIDGLGGLRYDLASPSGGAGGGGGSGAGAGGVGGSLVDAGGGGANGMDAEAGDLDAGGADAGSADADAACAPTGYDCEAAPPPGWAGPVAFYEGAPGTAPGCPAAYPSVAASGTSGIEAPPATCSACTCGAPVVSCSTTPFASFYANGCPMPPAHAVTLTAGACTAAPWGCSYFDMTAPTASVGPCAPSGGAPDLPAVTWDTAGIACGSTATPVSCADGTWCAPAPAAPFAPRWCIWAPGAKTCPSAFPQATTWETADDARGCTPCDCGAPGPATCTVTASLYSDGSCSHQVGNVGAAGECVHAPGTVSVRATTSPSGSPVCVASGGSPTGSVATTPAVTVCCPG